MVGYPLVLLMGLFGGSDGIPPARLAEKLGTRTSERAVLASIDQIASDLDTLAATVDIAGPDGKVDSDAPPEDKASALVALLKRDELALTTTPQGHEPSAGQNVSERLGEAIAATRRTQNPSGKQAATLLNQLDNLEHTADSQLESTLADTVDRLEEAHRVEQIADLGDTELAVSQLKRVDGSLATAIASLVQDAEASNETDDLAALDGRIDETIRSLSGDSPGPTASRADRIAQLCTLAQTAAKAEDTATENEPEEQDVATVASTVASTEEVTSATGKELLTSLQDPGSVSTLEAPLRDAVVELNTAATVSSLTQSIDRDEVSQTISELQDDLEPLETSVADVLNDRLEMLNQTLERADPQNPSIVYAVREEIRFYDRELFDSLQSNELVEPDAPESTDTDEPTSVRVTPSPEDLRAKHEEIESRYVEQRDDHNHVIPLHFLALADELQTEVETAQTNGEPERATGLAEAAESLLDQVEDLYRGPDSVLLRQLRD